MGTYMKIKKFLYILQKTLISEMFGVHEQTIASFYKVIAEKLGNDLVFDFIKRLGLLEDVPVLKMTTPVDTFSNYLSKFLALGMYMCNLMQCEM